MTAKLVFLCDKEKMRMFVCTNKQKQSLSEVKSKEFLNLIIHLFIVKHEMSPEIHSRRI